MTAVLIMLTVQSLLGAFDNLWHHEITEDLPHRPSARGELMLHAAREFLYAVIFLGIAWARWQGAWAWVLLAVLVTEIAITLTDFIIEDRTRHLPAFERVLHTVLAINFGAILAVGTPEWRLWAAAPTALAPTEYGPWSWIMTLFGLGVFAWAVRDLSAVIRLGVPAWQRNPMHRGQNPVPKTVLVTGATGFIGQALVRALVGRGDRVVALSRDPARARDRFGPLVEVVGALDALPASRRIDAVVNLAGAPLVGSRWTAAAKVRFLTSRLDVTGQVLALIRRLETRPDVLISGSAIGYYGNRADERLTEASAPEEVFMSALCRQWEARAEEASALGVRVCRLRIGLVLGRDGGAGRPLALAARFGLGMIMGSGAQFVSWIHRDDLVRLALFALDRPNVRGPINAVAPDPVPQAHFARMLGRTLRRPVRLHAPATLLTLAMGEMASLFLSSQRVVPAAAEAAGFRFAFPVLTEAMAALYGAPSDPTGLSIYMNDACPVCRVELEHYEAIQAEATGPLTFERIGDDAIGLPAYGLQASDLRRRLYVRAPDGSMLSGIDGFAALWQLLPRYRRLARLVKLPGLHGFSDMVYEGLCVPVLAAWNRCRQARVRAVQS